LRTALATLLEDATVDQAARLLADSWLYWALRGTAGEGVSWATRVLAAPEVTDTGDRATANVALAGLSYATGDITATRTAATAAVGELSTVPNEHHRLAEALVVQGSGALFAGDLVAAREPIDAAITLAADTGDRWTNAQALIARGQLLLLSGDVAGARTALADAEALARDLGGAFTLATALNVQAVLALQSSEVDDALDRLAEAAGLAVEVGTTWTLIYTLPALAVVASERGLPDVAVTLFAAGATMAAASSLVVSFPPSRESAEQYLATLESQVDATSFETAWNAGRDLRPADIAEYVAQIRRTYP
jgi:hypothetical protein